MKAWGYPRKTSQHFEGSWRSRPRLGPALSPYSQPASSSKPPPAKTTHVRPPPARPTTTRGLTPPKHPRKPSTRSQKRPNGVKQSKSSRPRQRRDNYELGRSKRGRAPRTCTNPGQPLNNLLPRPRMTPTSGRLSKSCSLADNHHGPAGRATPIPTKGLWSLGTPMQAVRAKVPTVSRDRSYSLATQLQL